VGVVGGGGFGPVHGLICRLSGSFSVESPKDLRVKNAGWQGEARAEESGRTARVKAGSSVA
jgi:hypothetical protein